jgi:FkbM family methyltransferase
MISYAQNFEDVILARVFRGRNKGFYVDVGAGDPTHLSVTKWFYDQGWSGINLEPNSKLYERLVAARPRDCTLNIGASDAKGTLEFTETDYAELSTFLDAGETELRGAKRLVNVASLNDILEKHGKSRTIDFIKVDVEGWELQVLRGLNLRRYRPTIFVVEAVLPESQTPSHEGWEPVLTANGYSMVYFDGLNRFYLAEERSDLASMFTLPPGVFDAITPHQVVVLSNQLNAIADAISRISLKGGGSALASRSAPASDLVSILGALANQFSRATEERDRLIEAIHPLIDVLSASRAAAYADVNVSSVDRAIAGVRIATRLLSEDLSLNTN